MRRLLVTLGALLLGLLAAGPALAASAQSRLRGVLASGMANAGSSSGALVLDLSTGRTLYSDAAQIRRLPASVEKLYTTTTALTRYGPRATLQTNLFGTGRVDAGGVWHGNFYLRGGGDPTFGTGPFVHANYGTGSTVGELADALLAATSLTGLQGQILGDESRFDSRRGTPPYGYAFNSDVEGSLSALTFNRDVNAAWTVPVAHPAVYAAQQLIGALKARGLGVGGVTAGTGLTPRGAARLAAVRSPSMAGLVALTLAPSDNFFAETLLKDIGADFGGAGTTPAGAAVVRAQLAQWGLHPRLEDGSGLSYYDSTSPAQVVSLLRRFAGNSPFVDALAVAGETGTLQDRMQGTVAQGRCRGKTGTLRVVSDLAGYCTARDGHTLVFALLMNNVDTNYARSLQDAMVEAIAGYNG